MSEVPDQTRDRWTGEDWWALLQAVLLVALAIVWVVFR